MISAILASVSALYRNCAQVPLTQSARCGSSASCFTQLRNCVGRTPRSSDACAYDTPRSLISRTASSLNSRVNCRLSMTHLLLHKTPNSVSSEPGAAHSKQNGCFEERPHPGVRAKLGFFLISQEFPDGLWFGAEQM